MGQQLRPQRPATPSPRRPVMNLRRKPKIAWLLMIVTLVSCLTACSDGETAQIQRKDTSTSNASTVSTVNNGNTGDDIQTGNIEIPSFDKNEFPKLDGSTATIPLGQMMYRMSTGATELDAATDIKFSKTTESYIKLLNSEVDLVIAYEAGDKAKNYPGYSDLIIEPIGMDALVFLCNQKNPVDNLSTDDIKSIYTGKIRNWRDVGGEDKDIIPFQRPENSGSQTLMTKLVMHGSRMMQAPEEWTPSEMGELIEAVARYDNSEKSIGYSVYYYAANMYQDPDVRMISVDGVKPESNTIRSGQYPYVNPFYVAIRKDSPENSPARIMFDWLTGVDGQSLINALGYVGVNDSAKTLPTDYIVAGRAIDIGDNNKLVISAQCYNGNSGIIVFDRNLKPEKFIPNIDIIDGGECAILRNNLILARNTEQKDSQENIGLYDAEKQEWVVEPVYAGGTRFFENGELRSYYLTNFDPVNYTPTEIVSVDSYGRITNELVDEERYYSAYQTSEPKNYSYDFQDDYSDFYFGNRLQLHRVNGGEGVSTTELVVDGKVIEKAEIANIDPVEAAISRVDRMPIGYIGISMYDYDNWESYNLVNNRFALIDSTGDVVYIIKMPPSEWVIMAYDEYYVTGNMDGKYKICNPDGDVITTWIYYEYDE